MIMWWTMCPGSKKVKKHSLKATITLQWQSTFLTLVHSKEPGPMRGCCCSLQRQSATNHTSRDTGSKAITVKSIHPSIHQSTSTQQAPSCQAKTQSTTIARPCPMFTQSQVPLFWHQFFDTGHLDILCKVYWRFLYIQFSWGEYIKYKSENRKWIANGKTQAVQPK